MLRILTICSIAAALLGSISLNGQITTTESGIGLHWQLPVTGNFRLGSGLGVQWWAEAPISPKLSLRAALGYHTYGGYRSGLISYENTIHPTVHQQRMHFIELNALRFAAADVGLVLGSGGASSRWSYALSARIAYLQSYKGTEEEQRIWRAEQSNSNRYARLGAFPLNENLLRGFDLGLQGSIRYRIANGVRVEASVYQGLLNQWSSAYPGDNRLWAASFSLGLSARVF